MQHNHKFLIFIFTSLVLVGCSSQKKDKTTLFIVGDSTVKNGRGDGAGGLWGWGDPIQYHFDTNFVNVENHALGGTSSRSFQSLGLWKKVVDKIQPGDYVLIQFGHNDGGPYNTGRARASIKGIGNDTLDVIMEKTGEHETIHTYGWYMRKYIADTRDKGGIPIIVTPIPRNIWEDGKVKLKEEDYPLWAKQVAEAEGIAYIDLNKALTAEMDKLGKDVVTGKYFFSRDHTHTSAEGAMVNARIVAEGVHVLPNCGLSQYIIENPRYTFPKKIRVVLIGDSTVAPGRDSIVGWGAQIGKYFDPDRVELLNKARGGRSSRTFYHEGLWDSTLKYLRKGDYVLMQFGHNDGGPVDGRKFRGSLKGSEPDSTFVQKDSINEMVYSYGWYLDKYVSETQKAGAFPIVLSPVPRNRWAHDCIQRAKKDYGKWAHEIAVKDSAYFVDLNEISAVKFEEIGRDSLKGEYFVNDRTHTTAHGADINAQSVIDGIKKARCPLRNYFTY